jgi:hypothetical protein
MNKLIKLKNWLTVPEAAKHLTGIFKDEEVTEADILRFALDGHLTLSVNFVNKTTGIRGQLVPLYEAKKTRLDDEQWIEDVIQFEDEIVTIRGVWDLTMLGIEAENIEHEYQMMTGGPAVKLTNLDGPVVSQPDGKYTKLTTYFDNPLKKPLYGPSNYYVALGLPKDAVLVVRTQALTKFIQSLEDQKPAGIDKPLDERERASLLVIIAALCQKSKINYADRGAVTTIKIEINELGADLSEDTIKRYLKRIPDALEWRNK